MAVPDRQLVVAWRGTYWTESLDDNKHAGDEPIGRRYFDFQTRDHRPGVQPDLDTPNNGYAEKFKHVIEPSLTIQDVPRRSTNFDQIVQLDGTSTTSCCGTTQFTYGCTTGCTRRRRRRAKLSASS